MVNEIISFEAAELAQQKGFDLKCRGYYQTKEYKYSNLKNPILRQNGTSHGIKNYNNQNNKWVKAYGLVSAPTQSLLQRWLREKYNIHAFVIPISKRYHSHCIEYGNKLVDSRPIGTYKSYEEALERALIEGLKLIDNG